MKKILPWLFLSAALSFLLMFAKADSNPYKNFPEHFIAHDSIITDNVSYKLINSLNGTYGYEIMVNGRLLVRQPTVPCMPGNEGFRKKDDAKRVAHFVMDKIKKGIMPPTVTINEMKSLGIKL